MSEIKYSRSDICRVALAQMNSNHNVDENLQQLTDLLNVHKQSFDLLFLPENFAHMPRTEQERLDSAEYFGSGKIQQFLVDLARQYDCWLVAGSVPLYDEDVIGSDGESTKIFQSTLVFDNRGCLKKRYDKNHLFDVQLANGERYEESRYISYGNAKQSTTILTPWGLLGLSICYDVRFPEHYRAMPDDIFMLSVPAAFTYRTGNAHWQILLQSRAIENQVYVAAAAQTGVHSNGRKTWGHTSLIDPWGEIVVQEEERTTIVSATIRAEYIDQIRQQMPCIQHKRR